MSTQELSTKQTTVTIGGMGCTGCAKTIKEALESKEGITSATVDFENETALISYDSNSVSTHDFKRVIEEAGYEFKGIQ
ncbi:MAG: heavy-metal-associated domain-containing protein [Balneolaceae bacterium]|nr:heavy-metal-associated domain-containing protein [Balneolaceae bacterium]